MFTCSCYIRIKDEAQQRGVVEFLDKIGYRVYVEKGETIITDTSISHAYLGNYYIPRHYKKINCKGSVNLFKALAALRDDSDADQWFTDGTDWGICRVVPPPKGYEHWGNTEGIEFFYLPANAGCDNFHKATPAELIDHFTNKS